MGKGRIELCREEYGGVEKSRVGWRREGLGGEE